MKTVKIGDIISNGTTDYRIVLLVDEPDKLYHFINYNGPDACLPGYFYNPTKSAFSIKSLEKYNKIGELSPEMVKKIQIALTPIIRAHNKAFLLCQKALNENPEFALDKFIKKS